MNNSLQGLAGGSNEYTSSATVKPPLRGFAYQRTLHSVTYERKYDAMSERIVKLEADMEHVKKGVDRLEVGFAGVQKQLGGIEVTLTRIDERTTGIANLLETRTDAITALISERTERVPTMATSLTALETSTKELPTKDYILNRLVLLLSAIAALVVFGDKIKTWIGLA